MVVALRNWGEEFSATWNQNITKDFTINVGGNITFLKNKVMSLASDLPGGVIIQWSFKIMEVLKAEQLPGSSNWFFLWLCS